jgi:hypothetical protein
VPAVGEVDSFSRSQLGTAAVRRLKVVPDGRKTPQAPPVDFCNKVLEIFMRRLRFFSKHPVAYFLWQTLCWK